MGMGGLGVGWGVGAGGGLADLAFGPQSRHNAENGSCNRGLFGPETAIYFLFNQKNAQPLHFQWKKAQF